MTCRLYDFSIPIFYILGIDFNFAFHTATSIQVVPELIPFRMSPHIISLMAPLNLTGLYEFIINTKSNHN